MKRISSTLIAITTATLLSACATGAGNIDTSRLSLVEENHAEVAKNGTMYVLDTYIVPFQRPYYVYVKQVANKSIENSEATAIAIDYIKPRGCTTPATRRPALDRSNSTKTQWLIGIEC